MIRICKKLRIRGSQKKPANPEPSLDIVSGLTSFLASKKLPLFSDPLQRDPYEVRTVEVRPSQLTGAQDGLFTLRHVAAGIYG
jgi:hypothetical protein